MFYYCPVKGPGCGFLCGRIRGDERMLKNIMADKNSRILFRYLAVSLFLILVSRIYSFFAHGVSSPWMTFLFAWPLFLGGIPSLLRISGILPSDGSRHIRLPVPGLRKAGWGAGGADAFFSAAGEDLYRFGIAAVTVGSLLQGIMEIAGTDSAYPGYLLAAGTVMLTAGVLFYIVRIKE